MVDQTVLKEINDLTVCAKAVLEELNQLFSEGTIPNAVRFSEDQLQFNIQMGRQCNDLVMNFNIYLSGINSYMLNLVSYFPQNDFLFPEGSNEETKLFKVRGAPLLGAHNLEKPIAAMSIDEATEASLEYVFENLEEIIKEAVGASGL